MYLLRDGMSGNVTVPVPENWKENECKLTVCPTLSKNVVSVLTCFDELSGKRNG